MSRTNLESLMTFPDGSHLVISTQYSKDGDFPCVLYSATIEKDDRAAFRVISNHLSASTCLGAQEHANGYAGQRYPYAIEFMK